ncbi:MAG: tripartite tricarboxylate transporter substrate binding protein [Betaproteobacteria bacterium]|nr:MAG: tripartite tricarboxylate transporter substrate binding protein [Betaproteobacteria bacterium]TMH80148.1 MAG: tripartite tricarboxylate transporter substrate binding protein [Betaproteobacteria bacterium]
MGFRVLKACALAALAIPAPAHAQVYPARPLRMIVAYPPGGGTDIVGRMLAQKLGESLGQSVVVENRGGASGNIGTELAAHAAPDGYTILMGNVAPNAINVSLFKDLPFDPVADFAPVSLVASTPNILVVHPSTPVRTVRELIALAKAKPGSLNFASAGVGSSSHLAGELFRILAGAEIVHVPYKGAGPAMVDVLSGQVQLYFATMPAAMPHVKSGKLAPVAVTSARRSHALPGLATIAESGVPGYEASTWYGALAPAHTPPAVIARLHAEIAKILADPALRARLADQGFEPVGNSPEEFGAYIKSEITKWGKAIRDAGIRPE